MLLKRLLSFSLIDLREYENFNRIFLVSNWLSLVMNYWHYYYSKNELIIWHGCSEVRNDLVIAISV